MLKWNNAVSHSVVGTENTAYHKCLKKLKISFVPTYVSSRVINFLTLGDRLGDTLGGYNLLKSEVSKRHTGYYGIPI
jgi:hypothetical protein